MSLPTIQTSIEISQPGAPEVLTPVSRPVPKPADSQVLIRVAAAGINRPDVFQRKGFYPAPPGVTDIPGLEVSGTVVAIGALVEDWLIGDQVCALLPGGGYAEYAAPPATHCLPVPKGVSLKEAACLPETFFTVSKRASKIGGTTANLKPGDTLTILDLLYGLLLPSGNDAVGYYSLTLAP
jgi:NADPH2:quinone reductase